MDAKIESLVNDMLVKGRLYIDAIKIRDEALVAACQSDSKETEVRWMATSEAAQKAHDVYYATIEALHAAREKR